ncbi:serine O-acetyltransferase EpsC [Niabella aquatica]
MFCRDIQLHHKLLQIHQKYRPDRRSIPFKDNVHQWIDHFISVLFPVNGDNMFSKIEVLRLELELRQLLLPSQNEDGFADEAVTDFFNTIPQVFEILQEDAQAILSFDPAAHSIEEVFSAYPGFYAVAVYRFAHELYKRDIALLPRLISEYAHSKTGIDINPGAAIGSRFFIDHGTGVVIGETCIIGNNVKVYQGVTLGALNVSKDQAHIKRHPTIEDNVVIYSGTTILGGNTIIGHNSVIGGNVWLTESVPPYSLVYHRSEIRVRSNNDFDEGINFSI